MAGGAGFRRLNLPVLLELGAHFCLGHFLTVGFFSEREKLFEVISFAAFTDSSSDFTSRNFLVEQTLVEFTTLEVRGLEGELRDVIERAKIFFRIAVAVETPAHGLRLIVANDFHFINTTMAGHAGDAAVQVGAVIEIHVVRSFVDFDPRDGLAGFVGLDDHLQLGRIAADVAFARAVAVEAGLVCRNIRVARNFAETVAIAAVEAELTCVNLV